MNLRLVINALETYSLPHAKSSLLKFSNLAGFGMKFAVTTVCVHVPACVPARSKNHATFCDSPHVRSKNHARFLSRLRACVPVHLRLRMRACACVQACVRAGVRLGKSASLLYLSLSLRLPTNFWLSHICVSSVTCRGTWFGWGTWLQAGFVV